MHQWIYREGIPLHISIWRDLNPRPPDQTLERVHSTHVKKRRHSQVKKKYQKKCDADASNSIMKNVIREYSTV